MAMPYVLKRPAVPIAGTDCGGADEGALAQKDLVAIVHTKRREAENVCKCCTTSSATLRRFDELNHEHHRDRPIGTLLILKHPLQRG